MKLTICDVLRDLVPFVLFKKSEKHPWRSVTFSKVVTKSNIPQWVFFTFFKLYKWCQIVQRTAFFLSKIDFEKVFYKGAIIVTNEVTLSKASYFPFWRDIDSHLL